MSMHFPGISVSVGNVMRGARSARVLTKIVYAEFCDSDVRNVVLGQIRSRNLSCQFRGQAIAIKPALSAVRRSRNWALSEAEKLVRAHGESQGKTVLKTSTATARTVTVDSVVVYEQTLGGSDLGSFSGVFSTLQLPVSQPRGTRSAA